MQSYKKSREMQKKMLFSFHFRVHVTSAEPKLQKIERKKKKESRGQVLIHIIKDDSSRY